MPNQLLMSGQNKIHQTNDRNFLRSSWHVTMFDEDWKKMKLNEERRLKFERQNSFFSIPFYKQIVPTVDTVRYQFLMKTLIESRTPIMLVGPVGTGKTSVAENSLSRLDSNEYNILSINMSARVSK